jgi:multidrug efflux pump subunit AcrA (membrane-fusion protein)
VFPIVRIVLVAVLAAALVKLAFFPDSSSRADPSKPSAVVTEPTVPASVGTITNDVTLKGRVVADPAVPVRSTAVGAVNKVLVAVGQPVKAGDTLYDIRVETPRDPVQTTAPDGSITMTERKPAVTFVSVTAPIGGVVSSLSVIQGQSVAIGDNAGQVAPPSFSATGTLSPEQQYRLLNRPTEAQVAIGGGPAPFTCTGLTITTPLAGAGEAPPSSGDTSTQTGSSTGSQTTVRCAIPAEVIVFSGLAADITIAGGKAENVIVVPTTAVKGTAQTGTVWVQSKSGKAEKKSVKLGLTDGTDVEITEGLAEGDLVRQFVPGAPAAQQGEPCFLQPDGSMVCGAGG